MAYEWSPYLSFGDAADLPDADLHPIGGLFLALDTNDLYKVVAAEIGHDWEVAGNLGGAGGGDAADVTYTPAVLTDWDGDADPGNVDDAMDQLAERIDDVEGAAGHAAVTINVDASELLSITDQELNIPTAQPHEFWVGPQTGGSSKPSFRTIIQSDLGTGSEGAGTKALYDDLTWKTPPAVDAADVTYTPAVATDWDSDADPGDVDNALDQLAERVDDLEGTPPGTPDAADVTYTPAVATDWDGDADPGDANQALDQLAERVDDLEAAGGGTDAAAIHDNVDGEISAITEKTSPKAADMLLIEDSQASNAKKMVQLMYLLGAEGGWIGTEETWTYASADDPTFTFTISGDLTGKYSAGMRIKLTQTTVKYFIITAVVYGAPNTTVTVYGGTDYDLADAAISANYYSMQKAPVGFPLDPLKWTVEVTDTSQRTQATPSQNTWYNPGSITISIPIGVWRVTYKAEPQTTDGSSSTWDTNLTLSTANNSESDADFTIRALIGSVSNNNIPGFNEKYLNIAAKTSYYLNIRTTATGLDNIHIRGDVGKTIIRAICAYL